MPHRKRLGAESAGTRPAPAQPHAAELWPNRAAHVLTGLTEASDGEEEQQEEGHVPRTRVTEPAVSMRTAATSATRTASTTGVRQSRDRVVQPLLLQQQLCAPQTAAARASAQLAAPRREHKRAGEEEDDDRSKHVIVRQVLRTALGSSAARHGCRRQCHLTRHKSRLAKAMHKVCPTSEGRLERAAVKPAAASVQGGASPQCRAHMMQAARCAALARF